MHEFNSDNIERLDGAVYLPRGIFNCNNPNVAAGSAFTTIIANKMKLNSNCTLDLNSDYGGTDVPALTGGATGTDIALVEIAAAGLFASMHLPHGVLPWAPERERRLSGAISRALYPPCCAINIASVQVHPTVTAATAMAGPSTPNNGTKML